MGTLRNSKNNDDISTVSNKSHMEAHVGSETHTSPRGAACWFEKVQS